MGKINSFISGFEPSEIADGRRLVGKLCLFLPLLLLVAAVNCTVDPANIYDVPASREASREYQIARLMASGHAVELHQEINDRLLQKYFIENQPAVPDVVVLGPSRSMQIGDDLFPGQRLVNNSVFIPSLEDYLGLYYNYEKKGGLPKRLILVLEPQIIDPGVDVSVIGFRNWTSIKADVNAMFNRLGYFRRGTEDWWKERRFDIFSFRYFQQSIERRQFRHARQEDGYAIADGRQKERARMLLLPNGRRVRPADRNPEDARELRRSINDESDNILERRLLEFMPHRDYQKILERFVEYLEAKKIQVTVLLVPFHPQLYQRMQEVYEQKKLPDIGGLENYYTVLARTHGFGKVGSYDPSLCGLEAGDFVDGLHLGEKGMSKLFAQYPFQGKGQTSAANDHKLKE